MTEQFHRFLDAGVMYDIEMEANVRRGVKNNQRISASIIGYLASIIVIGYPNSLRSKSMSKNFNKLFTT